YTNATAGQHGFLYSRGIFTPTEDPLATGGSFAQGINASGQIVGYYGPSSPGTHGFLAVLVPNPSPPAGTTADMVLRRSDGSYEIYDIGNNTILAAYPLGRVGSEWQYVGLGNFFGNDTTDMLLRNSNTGDVELYDIANNNITNAVFFGAVG